LNQIEFALLITEERNFILAEMKKQNLAPSVLAALSNLGVPTVVNFLEGRTFSPHHKTVVSLFLGLGYELALPSGKKVMRWKGSTKTKRRKTGSG
jgi:hypothetical protein